MDGCGWVDGRRRTRTQNGSCRRREMAVPRLPKVPKVPKTCMLTGWGGQGPWGRPGCREVCEEVCSPHLDLCSTLLVWCNARWARRSCQVVESKGCWVAAGGKAGKNLHPAYPFDRSSRVCSFKTGKAGSASGCAVDRGPLLAISRTRGRWGHTELDCVALSHLLLACWLPLATRRWRLGAEAKTALVVCVPSTVNILRMPGCGWRTLC